MTDASQSLVIGEFEHVAVGSSVVLLRVNGTSSRARPTADWRPTLVADDGSAPQRFAALPSPADAEGVLRAAYSVPAALLGAGPRFWLELQDGQTVALGDPSPGAARRPAPEDEHGDSAPDDVATLTAALAEARDRTTQVQGENETMSATLQELEIWRGELERRLADTTTELAETRARLADTTTELAETRARLAEAHAAAEMDALVARAEADALEQAARELTEAAEQARSRG